MSDVAARADVSAMTVSFVVNNKPGVKPETRQSVLSAIAELGYVPNRAARVLATGTPRKIGFLYEAEPRQFLNRLLLGAVRASREYDMDLILRESGAGDGAALATASELVAQGIDGLLIPASLLQKDADHALWAEFQVPALVLSPAMPIPGVASVGIDQETAAREVVRLLINKGHRRIAFVGGPPAHRAGQVRRRGYRDALLLAGIAPDDTLVVDGGFNYRKALAAVEHLLSLPHPPTAIFAGNDEMAAAAISAAHRMGVAIPSRLSIAGFDDAPIAMQVWPSLTTVRQPLIAIAEHAIQLIHGALGNKALPLNREAVVLPYEIVERESTDSSSDTAA